MSDYDIEEVLYGSIDEFRAQGLPLVKPAGVGAAVRTVRHRRQVRAALLAAVVAVLVAVPIAAFAGLRQNGGTPPAGPTVPVSPSATASQSSPSASPSGASSVALPPPGPPAASYQLDNATIPVPALVNDPSCPAGNVKLTAGASGRELPFLTIGQRLDIDVDRDGHDEIVLLLNCVVGETSESQVVVLRTAPGNTLVVLGTVLQFSPDVPVIVSVSAPGGGDVGLVVADSGLCCGATPDQQLRQQRRYHWNGSGFSQSGGSTSFIIPRDGTGVRVTGTQALTGLHSVLTFTAENGGGQSVGPVTVVFFLPAGVTRGSGGSWSSCDYQGSPSQISLVTCHLDQLAAGARRTVTLPLTYGADVPRFQFGLRLRIGDQRYADGPVEVA